MGPQYRCDVTPVNIHRRARVWLQFNCALFPEVSGGPEYVPWADLLAAIERWRAEQRLRLFFFVRKPPGLRLRFSGKDLDDRLLPRLVAWLDEAERRNAIRSYRLAYYEPEQARFGGAMGMQIAHAAFDRDSRHVMRYAGLSTEAQRAIPPCAFSLLLVNHLLGSYIRDTAELWDIWQRLSRVVGGVRAVRATAADEIAVALAAISDRDAVMARLPPDAARLLRDAWQDNAEIIARLHAAEQTARLQIGPRGWLATLCLFHWNRLALEQGDLGEMIDTMLRLFTLPERDA